VIAHNNSSENIYIQCAKLNGQPFDRPCINHEEIMNGGIIEFEMGNFSNKTWGKNKPPFSMSETKKSNQ